MAALPVCGSLEHLDQTKGIVDLLQSGSAVLLNLETGEYDMPDSFWILSLGQRITM